jgi:hypothetical protein
MEFAELRFVCQEAAVDLVRHRARPLPPTVVLPGPERTALLNIPDFPDDDEQRHAVLADLADRRITGEKVPAWGFVAEAQIQEQDAVVVVFGARRHAPHVTAAFFDDDGQLIEFAADEELDPTAMPFLHPLQHAVDGLPAVDQPPGPDDEGGLPIIG